MTRKMLLLGSITVRSITYSIMSTCSVYFYRDSRNVCHSDIFKYQLFDKRIDSNDINVKKKSYKIKVHGIQLYN